MWTAARAAVVVALSFASSLTPVVAQTSCSFAPVFGLFRQVAGDAVVGECTEPATFAENGDITQATTKGLAVYRYADQTIAFTDGQTTWLYGPEGLQSRANSDRFAWEGQGARTVAAPSATGTIPPSNSVSTAAPATAVPTMPAPSSESLALNARCSRIVQTELTPLTTRLGANSTGSIAGAQQELRLTCQNAAIAAGTAGLDCFETSLRQWVQMAPRLGTGGVSSAAAFDSTVETCKWR
jgi:hypothetical protein